MTFLLGLYFGLLVGAVLSDVAGPAPLTSVLIFAAMTLVALAFVLA